MATLSEHAETIKAAIAAARADGYRVILEVGDEYEEAYVGPEKHSEEHGLLDRVTIITEFD